MNAEVKQFKDNEPQTVSVTFKEGDDGFVKYEITVYIEDQEEFEARLSQEELEACIFYMDKHEVTPLSRKTR